PLVTVVTPSLNQGRFLRATIESVLRQDHGGVEYLIMDGGSTDETAAIAAEYSSRLGFVSEPDRGQADAINKGFRRARGEIVAWLNSDDLLLDGAVTTATRALDEHPEAAAVYGEGDRLAEDGHALGRFPFTEPFNLWKLVHVVDYVLQQSLFMRKAALEEVGYLDERLHYTLDWDLLIRLGQRYSIQYVPKPMGAIREHAEAKSFAGGRERIREIAAMLRKHTGMRYPPGLLLYALEPWRRRWWAAPVAGRWADRIRREAQGLYSDGWAGPRLRYMLREGDGEVSISGVSPVAQRLSVAVNGAPAIPFEVEAGAFELRVPATGVARLEIRASRHVMPASDELGPRRRLSYVLKRIEWT
ncbi:MAG: glycosyltransferase, partial [bacterium]|nr:glycosyltransferase [bacterium]